MLHLKNLQLRETSLHPLAGATVLQVAPGLDQGPEGLAIIGVSAALAFAGARALVACEGGRLCGDLQARGGIYLPFPGRRKNPLLMSFNIRRLARLIAAECVDVVHVRSRALAWVAYGAARLTKVPLVTSFYPIGEDSNPIALRYHSALARGDVVLADSEYSARLAERLFAPAGKIRTVLQGIDLKRFAPAAVSAGRVQQVRERWRAAPQEQIVLHPAATRPGNGFRVLLEAAGFLARSGLKGTKFVFACQDHEEGALIRGIARAIATEGLQDIACCAQSCDLPAELLAASAAVIPATDPASLGTAAMQAQAMGTPVIAANLGVAPEIVLAPPRIAEPMRTGFLVQPGGAAALALAIARVLSLGASAKGDLSSRAMEHAAAHFGSDRLCAATIEAYAGILRSRNF